MINDSFNDGDIRAVDFCASLTRGDRFFVPTDNGVQNALKAILRDTINAFEAIEGDWQLHDISEDYGERRRVYAPRNLPLFETADLQIEAAAVGVHARLLQPSDGQGTQPRHCPHFYPRLYPRL